MSNHYNEEILERLYDEEYQRLKDKYPHIGGESLAVLARYFAKKRFEEMEQCLNLCTQWKTYPNLKCV